MVNNKQSHWKFNIQGKQDTPYAGGIFIVNVKLPKEFPFDPPKIKFDTKIWHPNVCSDSGVVSMDVLKFEKWTPALNIFSVLLSIQALFAAPDLENPQDNIVTA